MERKGETGRGEKGEEEREGGRGREGGREREGQGGWREGGRWREGGKSEQLHYQNGYTIILSKQRNLSNGVITRERERESECVHVCS